MDPEYIQVRLRRGTAERLREVGKRLMKLVDQGKIDAASNWTGGLGMDTIINILIQRDERNYARHKRARQAPP